MALTSAAFGGLDVRLLVPRESDSRLVTHAARSYFDSLLAAGVSKALLDYALQVAQWPDDIRFGPSDKPRHAALSCLLVGSGAGGMPIAGSVEAILRAAVAAGNRLVEQELDHKLVIDAIEFIEVFDDVAIVAADALSAALRDDALAARVSAINEGTLHLLPDYGRMSRECLDVWRCTCRY